MQFSHLTTFLLKRKLDKRNNYLLIKLFFPPYTYFVHTKFLMNGYDIKLKIV